MRYSFSYFSQQSLRVRSVVVYLLDFLKVSQSASPKQLFLLSASCLAILSRCLNSIKVSLPLLLLLSMRQLLFQIRQYMNLQQLSWLTMISQFFWIIFYSQTFQLDLLFYLLRLPQILTSIIFFREVERISTLGCPFSSIFYVFLTVPYSVSIFPRLVGFQVCSKSFLPDLSMISLSIFPTENILPLRLYSVALSCSLKEIRLTKLLMLRSINSSLVILSSLFGWHILPSRQRIGEVILYFQGIVKGRVLIFLMSSFSLLDYQGVMPTIIQQQITPTAKISLYGEQQFLCRDQRGIYSGVPTFWRVLTYPSERIEKPKSPSFQILWDLKMLAGLISRCMTPILKRYLTASITSAMMLTASFSQSLPFLVRYSSKSPSGQYSVTMQQLFGCLYTCQSLRMLGWLSFFKIEISFSSISKLEFVYFLISMTLRANYPSLFKLRHRYTLLLQPDPISSIFRYTYSPIVYESSFRRVSVLAGIRLDTEPTVLNCLWESFWRE